MCVCVCYTKFEDRVEVRIRTGGWVSVHSGERDRIKSTENFKAQ